MQSVFFDECVGYVERLTLQCFHEHALAKFYEDLLSKEISWLQHIGYYCIDAQWPRTCLKLHFSVSFCCRVQWNGALSAVNVLHFCSDS